MALRRPTLGLAAVAVAIFLAACSGSSASSPLGAVTGGSVAPAVGGAASAGTGGGGTSGGGGGLPSSACALLTGADIQGVIGVAVGPGVEQDSDGQVDCEWTVTGDDSRALSLTVATYDDTLWQTGSAAGAAKTVAGLGDAAFKGWPTAGALMIKDKGDMITLGIADLVHDQATVDQEDVDLAKLVLSRL